MEYHCNLYYVLCKDQREYRMPVNKVRTVRRILNKRLTQHCKTKTTMLKSQKKNER